MAAISDPGSSLLEQLIVGTRASALARRQTEWVVVALQAAWPGLSIVIREFTTAGDRDAVRPLPEIGGKGLFTADLADALATGAIDLAVHSLKDLPVSPGRGPAEPPDPCGTFPGREGAVLPLCIGAVPLREDARDALISRHGVGLAELPRQPRIGTGSPRRAAQLLASRPDAQIVPLRGNVDTRLRKALTAEYDAIVLAAAGLARLGLADRVTQYLPFDVMLPAAGQGALAVQCRADDRLVRDLLAPIHDPAAEAATVAERAFLAATGGGCCAPVGAYGEAEAPSLRLAALVARPDGSQIIRVSGEGAFAEPEVLGARLAQMALASGAAQLLADCR